ncbi:MAG: hypothetical protein IJ689_04165 [Alphaproteobacteria bacterium]|nr:hypothetical protein [Alphaproteobacteria bacterium]
MVDGNKISAKVQNEQRFYPDDSEIRWLNTIYTLIAASLGLLLFMVISAKDGNAVLFFMFLGLLTYALYIVYFIKKSPQLYIDGERTYLRIKYLLRDDIVLLGDIQNYDYFNCYTKPLQYPFLCLCVRIFLRNGRKIEFFAFMKGAQAVIEDKMSILGIKKLS